MINLGLLDRQGLLYSRTPVAGAGGVVTYTKGPATQIYLTQVKIPIAARFVADRDTDQADAIFMSRWFDGLANGMLLSVEGHTYRIFNHQELGRRDGWQIFAREDGTC